MHRHLPEKAIQIILLVLICSTAAWAQDARRPVKIEGKSILPLRVLARSFSNVYKEKDVTRGTVLENIPVFQPFYVYTRPTPEEIEMESGWYEVGTDNRSTVIGWMQAIDVFEWKQTMCLAFTHPEGRQPVLMFDGKKVLGELLQMPAEKRRTKAEELYQTIASGKIQPDFPVKSVEPKKAVDISRQFYLLPILNHETIDIDGREGRLLHLAAAAGNSPDAREETDIRKNAGYLNEAVSGSTEASAETSRKLLVDVVWVMDTTVSMRPCIDKTLDVVKVVSRQITQDAEIAESMKFGIWGYRDSADDIPGIGYTTFNYTPALQPVGPFVETLQKVDVTRTDSVDYAEDVFSGVDDALRRTPWDPGAIRIIVLVGDAPGHELGHKWNLSGQNEDTLRAMANDGKTYIFALHVKEPKAKKFHEGAETQFLALSRNEGMNGMSAYWDTASNDLDGFAAATGDIAAALIRSIKKVKTVPADRGDAPPAADASLGAGNAMPAEATPQPLEGAAVAQGELNSPEPAAEVPAPESELAYSDPAAAPPADAGKATPGMLAEKMFQAALVEWIGSQADAKAPRDIVAWAVDKDLMEPAIQSMEVRLLINKRQLDSLNTVLSEVMAAGRRGQIGGEDFFSALQATAASAARTPDQIRNARSLVQTGLVPEFLSGLPYTSRLMDMTNELWASWSIDEQDQFLNELEARMKAYQAIHDTPEGWIALSAGDEADENVYPISLELLP